MTEQMKIQATCLLESYNAFLEERYVSYITSVGAYQDEQTLLDEARATMVTEWENVPLEGLDNQTPAAFIHAISDLDTLLELFVFISANTFDSTPNCLIAKLASYGDTAAQKLVDRMELEAAAQYDVNTQELSEEERQSIEVTLSAIQAFATPGFGSQAVTEKLLAFLAECNTANELFLEQTSHTLAKRISQTQDAVIAYISGVEEIGIREEYLLSALSSIAEEDKNDAIYKCLKASFLRMSNHMMGAVFLGDYGEAKAIPVLRRFAQQNAGKIPNDDYYAILAVIEKLGGIIDDLLLN